MRTFFRTLIADLARQYDGPLFEPHVTIHVGANQPLAAAAAVFDRAAEGKLLTLEALRLDHSDQFTKTLFVQFAPQNALQQLNTIIRNAARDSSPYELNPHLSLLYKDIPSATRSELANSISMQFSEVKFDALQAVRCISPTQTRADVEAWEPLAAAALSA